MDQIVSMATEIFGNPTKANLWLNTPDDRLAGQTPLEISETESGRQLVESMLWALDEGVFT